MHSVREGYCCLCSAHLAAHAAASSPAAFAETVTISSSLTLSNRSSVALISPPRWSNRWHHRWTRVDPLWCLDLERASPVRREYGSGGMNEGKGGLFELLRLFLLTIFRIPGWFYQTGTEASIADTSMYSHDGHVVPTS